MTQKTRIELQQENTRLGQENYILRKRVGDLEFEIERLKKAQQSSVAPQEDCRKTFLWKLQ